MTARKTKPKPGSSRAKQAGCTCATLDNAFGLGAFGTRGKKAVFVIMANCPLHGDGTQQRSKPA